MRAILLSVDYSDLLQITLPWNRHHFEEVWVVTSSADAPNVRPIVESCSSSLIVTDAMYERGAIFNKWAALEHGLDVMGREGWLCIMDADVLWPKKLKWATYADSRSLRLEMEGRDWIWSPGHLVTPLRRMFDPPNWAEWIGRHGALPEESWNNFPLHRNVGEWAGYSQIFHASDPALGQPPWHEVCYTHAGTADSLFQRKWPAERKVRPPFEVLHLGPAGQNWYGRATPRVDGSVPPEAGERLGRVRRIWTTRRRLEAEGVRGDERFREEKIS